MVLIILIVILILFIYLCFLISKKEHFSSNSNIMTLKNSDYQTKLLDIKKTKNYNVVYKTDKFWVWEPENIEDYIGTNQCITIPNSEPQILSILVKSEPHGMDRPKSFELINILDDDMKIWRIIPNSGYIGMGHIISKDTPKIHQYRCIKSEYVLPDKLKNIEYKIEDYNIWSGYVSTSWLCVPNSTKNINDKLYKYKHDSFKLGRELKVKNITVFTKIAEFNDIAFWENDIVNDYCSIGQIAYPIDKDPNEDGVIVPIIHIDFCKPINNYGEKILSFIYEENAYTIWRPTCYKGCGILSDIVVIGTEEPNKDSNIFSVKLDSFKNINYMRTMDWNSINSSLNTMYSIWCNTNKFFHITEGLDKPFDYDIIIDSNYIENDYDIMDKLRDITLTFNPEKMYNKYDMNQIINLIINTLSNRLDIRKSRLKDIMIKDNTINLKIQPKLKNISENNTKEICENIKTLIGSVPIKIYTNNRLDYILEINKMEEHYVQDNIIQLDNSEAIIVLSS